MEKNKAPASKLAAALQTPVFPQTLHQQRPDPKAAESAKPAKREKIFSKSRDTREDRGERQMKSSHNPQTMPHKH